MEKKNELFFRTWTAGHINNELTECVEIHLDGAKLTKTILQLVAFLSSHVYILFKFLEENLRNFRLIRGQQKDLEVVNHICCWGSVRWECDMTSAGAPVLCIEQTRDNPGRSAFHFSPESQLWINPLKMPALSPQYFHLKKIH